MLLVAGPALVAPDVANNAMPLFFARGVSRLQYMFGKWSALMLLTAAISWLPNCVLLLLFALGAESGWLAAHLHILGSAVVVPLLWASTCAWLALAVSAWVQSRAMARLVFLAVGLVLAAVGGVISQILGGAIGNLFDLFGAYDSFLADSLGLALEGGAQTSALMVFVVLTGLSIALLVRRLRPVEASK